MNPVDEDRALDGEDIGAAHLARGREAMDPTTRRLAWIAGGIGLLLVVLIGGWVLGGRHPGTIPVIAAPPGPVRLKPVDPGGMRVSGAPAYSSSAGEGKDILAPAPETPLPDALQAEVNAARRAAVPKPTAPAVQAPVVQPPPAKPAPVPPAPPNGVLLRSDAAPVGASGARAVQLAALDSDAAAHSEWNRLYRSHPALFAGHQPLVEQADHDGHAIYRLRTSGFASIAAAAAFCAHARTERVACTVADF